MGAGSQAMTETAVAGLKTPLSKTPADQDTQCQQGDTMLPADRVLAEKQPAQGSGRPKTWLQISSSDKTLTAGCPHATSHLRTLLG